MRKQLLNLKFLLMLCMIFCIGGGSVAFAEDKTSKIDFESEATTYSDWNFTNMTSKQTGSITAHGGTYYGTTGGKATASITTKEKIASPKTITFYVSKQSNNTTSSSWKLQISSNNSTWTDVKTQSATSMSKGTWVVVTQDLSSYSDVYIRIYYTGSTAVRNIDDVELTFSTGSIETKTVESLSIEGTADDIYVGDDFTHEGITVTATYDDETTADVTNSCEYSGYDMSTAGTQTVTVTYGEKTATYTVNVQTIGNTKETAYTATEAIELIDAGKGLKTPVYVKGVVSNIATAWTSTNGYLSFWVSEDGTENKFELYKNYKGEGKVKYASADECPAVGDEVICCGLLYKFNSTYELNDGNYLVEKIVSTDPTTNTLTITPGTSTFTKATDITMSATIDGTKIYYTTDGTEPSASSTLYEGAFKVTKTGTTVKAVAIAEGYDNVTAEATYTIKPDQPVFSEESKIFKEAFDVTLSLPETTDATSTIHYAIGSTATAESEVYSSAINISSETDGEKIILHAVVVDEYGNVGKEKYCTYTKTTATVFDFTQRPNVWNIEPTDKNSNTDESNVVGKDLAVDGIVMTSTSGGSNITCIYASSTNEPNLRVYVGGTITFTAPEGYNISEIKFTGSSLKNFISDSQTYTNPTWTGEAHAVTFTANGSVQVKTASIKIVPASSEVPTDVILHVGDALYSTLYYSDRALVVPENTEAYTYTVTNGQLVESNRYDENETIPAGVGVVVFALKAGEYTFAVSSQAGDVDEYNMLKGSDEDALTVGGDVYYKLSLNAENEDGTIGFYWGAEDGAAFTNKAHKAYLALTKEAAGAAKSFLLDGTTNGIGNISVQKTMNAPLYNISGQRVGKSYKGMVISNGKKYIQK